MVIVKAMVLLLGISPCVRPAAVFAQDTAEFSEFEDELDIEEGAAKEVFDPLIGYNRFMFRFNDKVWFWVWKPMSKGYSLVVPEPVRVSLNRVFYNFYTPVRFGNSLFQLKFERAGLELGRLLVNTTIGLAGFFDPADKWLGWIRPPPEDFGQTLGRYGVGEGFPLVLPLLGPSNLRDGFGWIPDILMCPHIYFLSTRESVGIAAGKYFNLSSLHLGEYESFKKDALDPYTFFRNAYKQNRDKRIKE